MRNPTPETQTEKAGSEWEDLRRISIWWKLGGLLAARLHNSICRTKITTVGSSKLQER